MIRTRGFTKAAVATALAGLLLAGCGGGGSGKTTATGGASGKPVAGGTAKVLTLSELRTLDPAQMGNNFASGGIVGNALYGTLLTDDPESGDIQYSMAKSFTTTDGGRTFELKLRDGLEFSDGSPLDAKAVKYNWDRMRDPKTASPYLSDAAMVASTTAVDATTLQVKMATAVSQFAHSVVTSSLNWIGSPTALAKGAKSFDAHPVGAGPYTLKEWRRQDAMELVKNPGYWDAPRPYLDSLTLRVALDATQRVNTVVSGGADLAVEQNWQNLKRAEDAGLPTDVMPLSGGTYLALNTRRAPFDDARARAALAAALDFKAFNVSVFDGAGQTVDTLFSKSSPFYADIPVSTPDHATAQRLFDQVAADGKPVTFTITTTSNSDSKAQAEAIQAQLGQFKNVTVKIKVVEFAEYLSLQSTHDFDAATTSASFLDPEPRLWTAFHSGSPANMSGIADKKLDAALLAGRTATDTAHRKAAYEDVQRRLLELHPMLWITRTAGSVITGKNVGGVRQYGFASLRPELLWIKR
ncbi:ABC transporter substrate-binding protein [Streptomyces sp. NBC_01239]|uniref:ABC transporter substrate-binding protein n=1 Tax=Streptomyces sp. NBC_01239 TaxID=2903792 RepID=UPI00224CB4E0|nr:ABC transporter substrate-binding protein [Streptomyces sp. NBC_01239]MCX4815240.1 ABC transporter substrate-binding protein [Streptomyces sp. NBC_01239]